MKTKLKIVLATILFMGLGGSLVAQITANDNITTSASVVAAITVADVTNLTFGNVSYSSSPSINASTGVKTACSASATLGKLTVTATEGASVNVTFTDNDLTTGGKTIAFTPSVYRTAITAATDGETEVTSGSSYTVNSSAVGAVAGVDHFFVGGGLSVGDATANPAGTYSGTFTLTVTYN